jgi:tRNA(Arg) A34 adenosine deaminase TadA
MAFPETTLRLPGWVAERLGNPAAVYPSVEDRMNLVIGLARENVRQGSGGPFAAAVFDRSTNLLVAPGVNLVVATGNSLAHAEMMAIMTAQRVLGHYDLGAEGMPEHELVASTEPCAMCMGAVPWSGVRMLVCGARDEDARSIGMDEGPKPVDWVRAFEDRGIIVRRDVCREEAVAVLQEYARSGGIIYNGRSGPAEVRRLRNPAVRQKGGLETAVPGPSVSASFGGEREEETRE